MPNPKIQLKFDRKLDQNLAWEFYSNQEFGGCNFWKERALRYHPKLSEIRLSKSPKEFLNKYVSEFYVSHSREIKELSQKTSGYLSRTQDDFFMAVDKIFDGYSWPKKKFTGFFSIFDFCPRFLNEGEFQVFIYDNRNMQLFTIFHEMLHFIFYNYAKKKFSNTLGKMETENGLFWDLAEVFNVVIQNTEDFIKIHGKIKNMGYPEHKKIISKAKKIWAKDKNVKKWIEEMIKILLLKQQLN